MKIFAGITLLLLSLFAVVLVAQDTDKELSGPDFLRKLEADFVQEVAKHGHDGYISYFAEDGVELESGGGISTKDAMRKEGPWPADMVLTWTPVHADMAASGDLGYTYGNYVTKSKDKDGKPVTQYGKYMSVWRKQKDGTWKVVADMGNASPEPK